MAALTEHDVIKSELRWVAVVGVVVAVIFAGILYAGLAMRVNPPSNIEASDPKTLHLSGEFTESNLGTKVEPDGQVTARIVATQFAFVPNCVVLPADREVTLRFASPDVIHGILVTGTNVNTMVVPGYVAQVHTVFRKTGDLLMPCHEFCGLGHSQMLGRVRVVPREQFRPGPDGRIACPPSAELNRAAPPVSVGAEPGGPAAPLTGPTVAPTPEGVAAAADPAAATATATRAAEAANPANAAPPAAPAQ
jgi:cytochrome c oxidase subunit 2